MGQTVLNPLPCLIEGKPQESQIARSEVKRVGRSTATKLCEQNCDNERPRVVIGGVTFWVVRDVEDGVFQDSRILTHPVEVIQFYDWKPVAKPFRCLTPK